jgi:hypothetical protein
MPLLFQLHIPYNQNVLYIKNDKLCTIENGVEIQTIKNVDEDFIRELKDLFRKEDINEYL